MKKMNLLVMSLVSAAALSFTSCSDSEDLANDKAGQNKVDKFYMTLTVQTPTSNGTRTAQNNPREASKEESYVTSGTFYLVDAMVRLQNQSQLMSRHGQMLKFLSKIKMVRQHFRFQLKK